MLSEKEKKELEMLMKDKDVKRGRQRSYDPERQKLYRLRWLKKKGMKLRESEG